MHNYNPRGIIKWAPFNALTKYEQEVKILFEEFYEEDYSVDIEKKEYISETAYLAIKSEEEITIQIIEENNIIEISTQIIKIDESYIYGEDQKFLIDSVYDIF